MVKRVATWEIAAVGGVSVRVSDRARAMRLTLTRDGAIQLTVPQRVPLAAARRFLNSRIGWIQRHRRDFHPLGDPPPGSREQARRILVERVRTLARAHGFTYRKVFVKSQKTLWGSCSSRNNINLNINLLRLPEELRDYVIAHELVHTHHKHHRHEFWKELDRIVGDGKRLQKKLRAYRLGA